MSNEQATMSPDHHRFLHEVIRYRKMLGRPLQPLDEGVLKDGVWTTQLRDKTGRIHRLSYQAPSPAELRETTALQVRVYWTRPARAAQVQLGAG